MQDFGGFHRFRDRQQRAARLRLLQFTLLLDALRRPFDLGIEIRLRAQAEGHRVLWHEVRRVPVRAVADRLNRRLRGADQPHDLTVPQLRMVPQQPQNRVRPVVTAGNRGIAWPPLRLDLRNLELGLGKPQPIARVRLAALDLFAGELAGRDRIHALDTGCDITIGNAFDLEQVHAAELGDLFECERSVFNQPHCRGFRHQGSAIAHKGLPPASAAVREDLSIR